MQRDVFGAIADPTRRGIIHLLAGGRMNVNAVAEHFNISRPAISKHMKILCECGLVVVKPQGRERYCEVRLRELSRVEAWISQYRSFWNSMLDTLEARLAATKSKGKTSKK